MGLPCHRNIKEPLSPLRARAPDPDCARAGAAPAPPAGAAWAAYQRRLLPAPTAHPNVPTLLGTAPPTSAAPAPEDRWVEEAHGKGRHGGEEDAGRADEGG